MVCSLCPRKCFSERNNDSNYEGFCKAPTMPVVSRAALHFGEEPCISGKKGSGTVFFSGCPLGCVFCQNYEISHKINGKTITTERLSEIFKELYESGAENINLVNPTHYVSAIKKALDIYKPPIPIVYNSSGYESEETLKIAESFADVYLMDLKYLSKERALKYSGAKDYPEVATKAILKCVNTVKNNKFDERGILIKGLIIRHLILPMGTNEAISVIEWVKENTPNAILSILSQYTPFGNLTDFKEINRKITKREHEKVLDYLLKTDLENVYVQELSSADKKYIPSFDLTGI